eukprot:Platyproteum_vivax@DN6986_c0_g1_i1.p1
MSETGSSAAVVVRAREQVDQIQNLRAENAALRVEAAESNLEGRHEIMDHAGTSIRVDVPDESEDREGHSESSTFTPMATETHPETAHKISTHKKTPRPIHKWKGTDVGEKKKKVSFAVLPEWP